MGFYERIQLLRLYPRDAGWRSSLGGGGRKPTITTTAAAAAADAP